MNKVKVLKGVILTVILVFLLIRFVNLDADRPLPVFAQVDDEMDKTLAARYNVLWGTWFDDDIRSGLFLAPLFSVVVSVFYKIWGVSLYSTRLISVFAGILSVILLYLILRKGNKKVALFSAFLLSINHLFFILNRVGLTESIMITMTLLGFYILSLNNKGILNYLLAGLVMGAGFLFKISHIYVMPIMGIFFLIQFLQKRIKIKHILCFVLSYGAVVVGYLLWVKSNYSLFAPMIAHGNAMNLPYLFLPRTFILFVNYFFSYPSIFLLILLTVTYFVKFGFPRLNWNDLIDYLKKLSFIEKFAFSWLVGFLIGAIFSPLVARRQVFLIIPLVIYSSLVLFKKKDKVERKLEKLSFWQILLVYVLSISFVVNYLVLINKNIFRELHDIFGFSDASTIFEVLFKLMTNFYFILLSFMFVVLTLLFIVGYFKLKNHKYFGNLINKTPLFILISLLSLGFVKFNYYLFLEKVLQVSNLMLSIISFLLGYVLYLRITKKSSRIAKELITIYVVYCVVVILLFSFLYPSYTVKGANQKIDLLTEEGDYIVGHSSYGLSIESHIRPIALQFKPFFNNFFNYSVYERYRPKLFLYSPGESNSLEKEDIPYALKYRGEVRFSKVFGWGRSRHLIEIYEIDYDLNSSTVR